MRTEIRVPSDLRFLTILENWLLDSLALELEEQVDWQHQSCRLRLALVEAYSNVVRHAHRDRPELPVEVKVELDARKLHLEIWDCGQGFDLSTYLPPSPQEHREGGYGWLILNRLMDRVEYQLRVDGKNCLTLETTLPER